VLPQQSPERDVNGRPIRTTRRQTIDLKVLLGDSDSEDNDCVHNDDDSDDDCGDSSDRKNEHKDSSQSGHVKDNTGLLHEESQDSNISTDVDSKLSEAEPPKKRRRLKVNARNEDKTMESKSADYDDVEKWAEAIIKYHQKTQDNRTWYASCCVISAHTVFCF